MKRTLSLFMGVTLCFITLGLRAEEQPLATRVDHFFAVSDKAQSLFTFFKDTFQLPESWPFSDRGTHVSGGLWLGNAILEFLSHNGDKPVRTEFRGIALESTGGADETADELTKTGIPHTEVENRMRQGPDGQTRLALSIVRLKDFPPVEADVFFVDYKFRKSVAASRKAADDELAARNRGPLGIVGVAELTVGVQDLDDARRQWSALLAPSPQISEDVFVFSAGPRIRLVRAKSPGIQGIVLSVRSLDEVEKFLKERDLLARDDAGHISISTAAIEGLSIQLVSVTETQKPIHPLLGTGRGVDHVGIGVRDLEKAKRDYEQVLGFKCIERKPEPDGALTGLIFFENKCFLELLSVPRPLTTEISDFHRDVSVFIEKHESAMYLGLETSSAKDATDFLKVHNFEAKLSEHRRVMKEGETKPSPVQVYSVEFADKPSGNKQAFMLWIYLVEYVDPGRPARLAARREKGMMAHPNTAVRLHSVWFAVRDLDAQLRNLCDAGFEPGETREAKFLGAEGREVKAGLGSVVLLRAVDENGPLSKFLSNHDDGEIIAISIEVADLNKARSWVEDHSERKLEPYDGFYGRSVMIPPDITHGVWMEMFQRDSSDDFVFRTEVHADILLHAMAHMDIGKDDSSRYSEDYIKGISLEKQKLGLKADLKNKMDAIKDVYISDNGLRRIRFLPFFVADYEEFITGLNWLATDSIETAQNQFLNSFKKRYLTTQEQRDFIKDFAAILDHEYQAFYRDYWKKEQERLATIKGQFEEFAARNGRRVFSPVMKKEKKNAVVFLCLSMTRAGRGFSSQNRFGAAVKFPETREEFLPSFFMAVHEMTHQFSTALVMKAENMESSQRSTAAGSEGYRIHLASEYGAIYADYLLFRKFLPEYLKDYCLFFLGSFEKNAKDASPEELEKMFRATFEFSDKSVAAIADYINKL